MIHIRRLGSSSRAGWLIALCLCIACLTGCLNSAQRADRAMQAGQYEDALTLYEQSISDGSRDPQVFYHAAICAMKLGSFADAERHFSRSLRYGGGSEVARALAQLYIQTSNYAKAIRVLQIVLNDERIDPQPIYNNLGTALMYAGEVLDAESYLLIAQQLDPKDPFPYVNLGLLYDRYLRQPKLALDFYGCYLNIASQSKSPQLRSVKLRVYELQERERQQPAGQVVCGQPYNQPSPANTSLEALKALKAQSQAEDAALNAQGPSTDPNKPQTDPNANKAPEELFGPQDPKPTDPNNTAIPVDHGGELPPEQPKPPQVEQTKADLNAKARLTAREHYSQKRHQQAIEALEIIPPEEITGADALLLARAHRALSKMDQAQTWYQLALQRQEEPLYLQALIEFLQSRKQNAQVKALCDKYKTNDQMSAALISCP